jgi:NAD(P)-dependent dehydrogenase (short-subunit alcohol dehydrogenase family)
MTAPGVAVVAGAGPGLGAGIARRFAAAGLNVALIARKEDRLRELAEEIAAAGGRAFPAPADVRDEAAIAARFAAIEADHGPIEAVAFNAGAQYRAPLLDTSPDMFEKVWRLGCYAGFIWRLGCYAGFIVGREAARVMAPRGRGSVLFTGATAAQRGGAEFAAFAASKFGLRALAQSMAREFGPQGLHVAHIVVDGLIDTATIRARFPDVVAKMPDDGMLSPDDIGQVYVDLHRQPRSAWSFEVDLRPWTERF